MSSLRLFPLVLGFGLLAGCEPADTDEDGISDDEEAALGLDPELADSDGDGIDDGDELNGGSDPAIADTDGDALLDGDELELGTDPAVIDTDGDTYRDGDEVTEGTDPLDPDSRIYIGYWPYNPNKEDMIQNGIEGETYKLGKQFGRVKAVDQWGEVLDLYDFANPDGKPVIFDVSAEWCGPCNDIAAFLDGDDDLYGYEPDPCFLELRTAINKGDVYWLTVIGQDNYGNPGSLETNERWYEAYPKDQIPVLADEDYSIVDYVALEYWPTVILLDSELKPKTNEGDAVAAMCGACEMIGAPSDPSLGWCL